jgi:hypothetical protein
MKEFGLIEFFRPRANWYQLSSEERAAFLEKVTSSITQAEDSGAKLHGPYRCRWSTEWEMFAFWELKSLEAVEALAQDAEDIGWYKYFEQSNIVGSKSTPKEYSEKIEKI